MRRLLLTWLAALAALASGIATADVPDYRQWDGVLVRNVRNGFVDYDGIKADPAFARFVGELGNATATDLPDRAAKLAFYINAYNALAIQGVLNGDAPDSLLGRLTFFKRRSYRVLGTSLTLDQIEKERLAALGEPRVHFAIVCASLSCPRLASRAFWPTTVEAQLDAAARAFINDATRNRYDPGRKLALLSAIFDWYADDFGRVRSPVAAYLAGYVRDPAIAADLAAGRYTLRYTPYDWNLNGVYRAKP